MGILHETAVQTRLSGRTLFNGGCYIISWSPGALESSFNSGLVLGRVSGGWDPDQAERGDADPRRQVVAVDRSSINLGDTALSGVNPS